MMKGDDDIPQNEIVFLLGTVTKPCSQYESKTFVEFDLPYEETDEIDDIECHGPSGGCYTYYIGLGATLILPKLSSAIQRAIFSSADE